MSENKIETVTNRRGEEEPISFDKIKDRLRSLAGLSDKPKYRWFKQLGNVKVNEISIELFKQLYDKISTTDLDIAAASLLAFKSNIDTEYEELASRVIISNHQKNTDRTLEQHFNKPHAEIKHDYLSHLCELLYTNIDDNGMQAPLINPDLFGFVKTHSRELNKIVNYKLDYLITYPSFKLLEKNYLIKCTYKKNNQVVKRRGKYHRIPMERPQDMFLRVAMHIATGKPYKKWSVYDDQCIIEQIKKLKEIPRAIVRDFEFQMSGGDNVDWSKIQNFASDNVVLATKISNIVKAHYVSWEDQAEKAIISWKDQDVTKILERIKEIYEGLSNFKFIHATPTLFNSGTRRPQASSCYLQGALTSDSMKGITHYYATSSELSKNAGGLGGPITPIRAQNSYISGTNGSSNGLEPLLGVIESISTYVDQGGKRPGSNAIYIEPWHAQVADVLELKRPKIREDKKDVKKTFGLFYGMYVNDEFMRTVTREVDLKETKKLDHYPKLWYLMDPNVTNYLWLRYDKQHSNKYLSDEEVENGDFDFTKAYRKLVKAGRYVANVSATEIYNSILDTIREAGVPYMKFKDNVNRKNNQSHYGTIITSNLCAEIDEYVDVEETAVCNLASLCLPNFLEECDKTEGGSGLDKVYSVYGKHYRVNKIELEKAVCVAIKNLDTIIDINYYPVPESKKSNLIHRPTGLGFQGWADMLNKLLLSYDSEGASHLAFYLHEFIYFMATRTSKDLAKEFGTYPSYEGSPASQGKLQWHLWVEEQGQKCLKYPLSMPWDSLVQEVKTHGVRNSLTICGMPTASVSTLTGLSPGLEPNMGMCIVRKNNSGENIIVNKNLSELLKRLGYWNQNIPQRILGSKYSSISEIEEIPEDIREAYKTAWELKPAAVVLHALTVSPFIDQSISMNLFLEAPSRAVLNSIYMVGWSRGLKTGSYYCRSKAAYTAEKTTLQETSCESCQ